jgi:hypothetical protein
MVKNISFGRPRGMSEAKKSLQSTQALDVGPESEAKIANIITEDQSDGNWSSFQLAKSTSPQSVIDNAIAPSARI